MKSVALHNLGCKVNAYELEAIGQKLQENGYSIVPFEEKADIYIINTCTVTNIADRKSRQMLHRARKRNPAAVVVALGCYVQTGKEKAVLDESIDLAVGNNRKKDLPEILEAFLKERKGEGTSDRRDGPGGGKRSQALSEGSEPGAADMDALLARKTLGGRTIPVIGEEREYEEMRLDDCFSHTRAYIKIQDGCNQFCSYCIIPYARGRVRSRRQEDVLSEIAALAEKGFQEVVLTGIHISSYGMDFAGGEPEDYLASRGGKKGVPEGSRLLGLIRAVSGVKGIERIRLGSLEPRIVTREFVEGLAALPKVCPHFHLSLQSGCDETLRRMNRHYTAREYSDRVQLLREIYDNPAITTDVIVGFPGETEEEFQETERFLRGIGLFEMHIFKYSVRQKTLAASMPDQVSEQIKNRRSERLLELERKQSEAYRRGYIGKKLTILTEDFLESGGCRYLVGHTPSYVRAALPVAEGMERNRMITGMAAGFLDADTLLLKP